MIASAITPAPDDPDPHRASAISLLLLSPTATSDPSSSALPRSPPARRRPDRAASTAAAASRRRRRDLAARQQRAAQAERRQALLVLGADVAGLVDRLGIVAARAVRGRPPPTRTSPMSRAVRTASSDMLGLLEVPQRPMRPDVGRPVLVRVRRPFHGVERGRRRAAVIVAPRSRPPGRQRPARRDAGRRGRSRSAARGAGDGRAHERAGARHQPPERARARAHPRRVAAGGACRRRCPSARQPRAAAAELVDAVDALPRQVEVVTPEVAVGGGLPVDRPAQVEVADDRAGPQVERPGR